MPNQDLAPGLIGSAGSLIGIPDASGFARKDDSKPRFPSLDRSDNSNKPDEIISRPYQDVVPMSL